MVEVRRRLGKAGLTEEVVKEVKDGRKEGSETREVKEGKRRK